jgi:acyl carrier protein
MDVEAKVKEVLLEILDIKEEEIVPTATFIDDLKATSIDMVEILTAFQNTFDVEIDETQASKLKSVQDAIQFLQASVAQKKTNP